MYTNQLLVVNGTLQPEGTRNTAAVLEGKKSVNTSCLYSKTTFFNTHGAAGPVGFLKLIAMAETSEYVVTADGSIAKDGGIMYDDLKEGEAQLILKAIDICGSDKWDDIEDVFEMLQSYQLY